MKSDDCANIIARLETVWNSVFDDFKREIYAEGLGDLNYQKTLIAVKLLTQTDKFLPAVARIREACYDLGKTKKTALDAIAVLTLAVSKHGYNNAQKALGYIKEQDELLYRIVQSVGYRNICMSDMNFMRKEISGLYTELLKEESKNELVQQRLLQAAKAMIQDSALSLEAAHD